MRNTKDSLNFLKKSVDSLNKVVDNKGLLGLKYHEASVQAAIIIAMTTVFTVILGFMFKDYWIPGLIENRTKKKENQYIFIQYKINLFKSSYTFLKRLHEIYVTRSHYLWKDTPMTTFYEYKYKSSVYRLCVLLGWIRAYRLMESSIILKESKNINLISSAIGKVESYFADGQGIEMYVVKSICKICQIDINSLIEEKLLKFSIGIDDLVQVTQIVNSVDYISDLRPELKDDFISKLIYLMNDLGIPTLNVKKNQDVLIKEVSIKLALIYRDWQQAIGDIMIVKTNDSILSVISFKDFERMWSMEDRSEEKLWLKRAERIFENLDLRVDKNSDSRIDQLKHIYSSIYNLMSQLYDIKIGPKPISQEEFNKISKEIIV